MNRAPVIPVEATSGDLLPRPLLRGEIRTTPHETVVLVQIVCTCGFVLNQMPSPHAPEEVLATPGLDHELYAQAHAELPAEGFRCYGCGCFWHALGSVN